MDPARFARELVPTMLVMESADAANVVGYTFFQVIGDVAYVRHIVSAPEARRTGVGHALLEAVVRAARAAGCTTWCLNVKPDNTSAIALYEKMGLARAFMTKAMRIDWSIVDATESMHDARIVAREIEPSDDAAVEAATKLLSGQIESARERGDRVLMGLFESDAPVGMAVFDPRYPGAYPFRVNRPELAMALLRAIQPHALEGQTWVQVVSEGQPEVAASLLAAGATLKLDIQHMRAPLPSA